VLVALLGPHRGEDRDAALALADAAAEPKPCLKPATLVGVKRRRAASCAISALCRLYGWSVARARSDARQPAEPSRLLTTRE
jgi:hypothetical protein